MTHAAKQQITNDGPSVWIGCLAAYNNGKLHGRWFEVTTEDQFWADVKTVMDSSPEDDAEEWFLADNEGFGSYDVGEHPDVDEMIKAVELLEEHGEVILDYAAHLGESIDDQLVSSFEEAYCGEWRNFQAYADDYVDSTGMLHGVDEHIVNYFDYEKFAHDLSFDHFEIDAGGSVHVFRNI